jgi:deoxyribodipyrimidine photolyase-related protein
MNEVFIILGNQLFDKKHLSTFKKNCHFFMQEDYGLCTYYKHHKQKIYYFLASMREYRDYLNLNNFKLSYYELEKNIKSYKNYFDGLNSFLKNYKKIKINIFDIEDVKFKQEFEEFCNTNDLKFEYHPSPMFLLKRDEFSLFSNYKKPQLANFYSQIRKKFKILMDDKGPIGGKWSFDDENRKRLPKNYDKFDIKKFKSKYFKSINELIIKYFPNHFGELNEEIIFPFNNKDSKKVLDLFFQNKLIHFGDYEDFISTEDITINHSLISAPLNMGLITPFDILKKISDLSYEKVGLNNYEGFVRQIFGWREFIRYLNVKHYEDFHQNNFFKNNRKLSKHWYDGTTSIPILNESIHILKSNGYVHHIPRLMVLSNIMNLCGINPQEVYKWFMETFIDSSDWVMTPNVFGMGLFSDGGIFATKPYICGSNYLLKMSNYTKGDWTKTMDGLYWNFIFNNKDYFKSNHRLSMMYYSINKMDKDKLSNHLQNAKIFIETYTKK